MSEQIVVLRIAGKVKNKKKDDETLKRLRLNKKFTATIIASDDAVRVGMVEAVSHMISYGPISDELIKDLKEKRKEKENVFFLHPPIGGFKKSSKVKAPKGILGKNDQISKLIKRMI